MIYADRSKKQIIVSFRGSVNYRNWISNTLFTKYQFSNGIKVHRGFYTAYKLIRTLLQKKIERSLIHRSNYEIVFTGHSLGGALATLATADALNLFESRDHESLSNLNIKSTLLSLITFGSPRVGNAQLSDALNRMDTGTILRVTNTNDIVPHIPPRYMGFKHVGKEVWINSNGNLVECDNEGEEESFACSNRINHLSDMNVVSHSLGYLGIAIGSIACSLSVSS